MAQTRSFSVEDASLNSTTLITGRTRAYTDIDLTFENRPSGDVYKKRDAASVKQAIKTILLTNHYEKPFKPFFGANIQGMLFELADDETAVDLEDNIKRNIQQFEPRAQIQRLITNLSPDANSLEVTVIFKVVSTEEIVSFNATITRLR